MVLETVGEGEQYLIVVSGEQKLKGWRKKRSLNVKGDLARSIFLDTRHDQFLVHVMMMILFQLIKTWNKELSIYTTLSAPFKK